MASSACVYFYPVLLWIFWTFSVVASDICSYTTYDYNSYDKRYERMVSFKRCQWGCCWKFSDPCCSLPVGLIVGCVVGGLVLLAMVIVAVCCCCCCQRRGRRNAGTVVRYPTGAGVTVSSGNAAYQSSTSDVGSHNTITTTLPPGVYDAPPSYDEVMAGEMNPAFKPDADTVTR
ncbi:uncharacterized protein [Littorina saxatilis]|uniref:Uncharacterized protein n=1 Tax=Littorina saxatilis TaxID=31220 RepID=A0AAN9BBQ1_9CAEN